MSTHTDPNHIDALIASLDTADALPGAAELRTRSYDLLALRSGDSVVDVGCGAGRAVAELAGRGAKPYGIDISEQMVAAARRRSPELDVRVGDLYQLPFGDGELRGYRADKVYHDLVDPARALDEAWRVLAPGGRIVLVGQDWDTFVIDSDHPAQTRRIVHGRADLVASPRTARRYRNLLLDHDFVEVTVEVYTSIFIDAVMLPMLTGLAEAAASAGAVSAAEAEAWIDEQRARAHAGRLFLAIPMFLAAATRP